MPLKSGSSRDVISSNIAELLSSYHDSGMIGNIEPKSEAHAKSIASAIAYKKARESKHEENRQRHERAKAKRRR